VLANAVYASLAVHPGYSELGLGGIVVYLVYHVLVSPTMNLLWRSKLILSREGRVSFARYSTSPNAACSEDRYTAFRRQASHHTSYRYIDLQHFEAFSSSSLNYNLPTLYTHLVPTLDSSGAGGDPPLQEASSTFIILRCFFPHVKSSPACPQRCAGRFYSMSCMAMNITPS
jgi:hypothetical protein